MESVYVSC